MSLTFPEVSQQKRHRNSGQDATGIQRSGQLPAAHPGSGSRATLSVFLHQQKPLALRLDRQHNIGRTRKCQQRR